MSNRAATILAVAAVISSLCMYATFAQDRPRASEPEGGAIFAGPPRVRLQQELPGRYQLTRLDDSSVMVIDTHTGRCWSKRSAQRWIALGSPVDSE